MFTSMPMQNFSVAFSLYLKLSKIISFHTVYTHFQGHGSQELTGVAMATFKHLCWAAYFEEPISKSLRAAEAK